MAIGMRVNIPAIGWTNGFKFGGSGETRSRRALSLGNRFARLGADIILLLHTVASQSDCYTMTNEVYDQ